LEIHELGLLYNSDTTGIISIPPLKNGIYHLHVRALGYKSLMFSYQLSSSKADTLFLEPSHIELFKVDVEESRSRQNREELALQIVTVEGAQLLEQGQQSVAAALANIPGVQAITTGPAVAKPLIRGLGFNRIAVFDHGIRQEGQQWGADHGLEMDLLGVEKVDIIKGPGALLYGPDAMSGVISFLPQRQLKDGTLNSKGLFQWRSVNESLFFGIRSDIFFKPISLKLTVSQQDFGDFKVPSNVFLFNGFTYPLWNQKIKNTAGRERSARAELGYFSRWGFSSIYAAYYDLNVGFFSGAHGIPTLEDLLPDESTRNVNHPYQSIRHIKIIHNNNIRIGRHWFESDVGYQQNLRQEFAQPHSHGIPLNPSNTLEHSFFLTTWSVQSRFHHHVHNAIQIIYSVSGQYKTNKTGGFEYLIPDFDDWMAGSSALVKWTPREQHSFTLGLRGDYAGLTSSAHYRQIYENGLPIGMIQASSAQNRRFLNFSGALGFSTVRGFNTFKAHIGNAFRTPAVVELSANGMHHGAFRHEVGDSALKSERAIQLDFSFLHSEPKFFVSMSTFFNYFFGFIYLNPTEKFSPLPEAGLIWHYEQSDGVHTGIEAECDVHPLEALHIGAGGQFVYTIDPATGYSFPLMPPATGLFRADYTLNLLKNKLVLTPGLEGRFSAPQFLHARNELFTPGFAIANLRVQGRLNFKFLKPVITFRVDNLLNSRYFNHLSNWRYLGLPEPGRNFLLSISLPLEISVKKPVK